MSCLWIAHWVQVTDPFGNPKWGTVDQLLSEILEKLQTEAPFDPWAPSIESRINHCRNHTCDYSPAVLLPDHAKLVKNGWEAAFPPHPQVVNWQTVDDELDHGGGGGDFDEESQDPGCSAEPGGADAECPWHRLPLHVRRAFATIVLYLESRGIEDRWEKICKCMEALLESREGMDKPNKPKRRADGPS